MGKGKSHRIEKGLNRGEPFDFLFDDLVIQAYPGETIAGALLAAGHRRFRTTVKGKHPRGYYCGMGICWECTMVVEDTSNVRACMTLAEPGMKVITQEGFGPEEAL